MAKPIILTVDDDVTVSPAITRDLRSRYADRYRIVRATSGDADQFLALDRLRDDLARRPTVSEGALEAADREELLGTWIGDRRVDNAWHLAATFAARGVDREWLESVHDVVGADGISAALRWLATTADVDGLLTELADATSRISHLVQDVKTYSQMDRASLQCTNIADGIESTLTMLAPKMSSIEVVRSYGDVPETEVYAAELNQVWTNLIDNALDAMGDSGTLRLTTRLDGDDVVIEINDSGPGIPADIQRRVFEPFFTTKDVGSGTGLGLDISRRIVVDRHRGEIEFESSPGSTTARVRLPMRR